MKKLFLGSFAMFLAISAFPQNSKINTAYSYMESYTTPEGANSSQTRGDAKNLEEAAKNIDQAIVDPSTSGSWKAWWYRSEIYQLIASEKALTAKYPNASMEVFKSFQKLVEINDPKFKEWKDAYVNMNGVCSNLFNDGVAAFQKKNYHDAYVFFNSVGDMQDLLVTRGQKRDTSILNRALSNAAFSADNDKDYASAIAAYKRMLSNAADAKSYVLLISMIKKARDMSASKSDTASANTYNEEAKKYTTEGLAKYPNEKDLLIDKINFSISDGKYSDAIGDIQKAIAQDPKNEQLQIVLGMAYEQANDTVNARKTYLDLIALNPNSFDANFHLGAMIFNSSVPIQKQMNDLGSSKADAKKNDELELIRNAIFLQAKPYLEKALSLHPDDAKVKNTLNVIEVRTKK